MTTMKNVISDYRSKLGNITLNKSSIETLCFDLGALAMRTLSDTSCPNEYLVFSKDEEGISVESYDEAYKHLPENDTALFNDNRCKAAALHQVIAELHEKQKITLTGFEFLYDRAFNNAIDEQLPDLIHKKGADCAVAVDKLKNYTTHNNFSAQPLDELIPTYFENDILPLFMNVAKEQSMDEGVTQLRLN